ncbi:DUF1571 domain-containing protein [Roseimaritima ulvae]|uniref:DUF1571 domain-containing protein n=1 Tax=Roseimaritima ulvae TaxID=980254 RepID=A0A5B9QRR9_9BACT|nr:DUF1571 domain-containing protein [Roseimaritima ulvae]QEG41728.1 hypothetical protein UC8_37540 [Roseimaritima ulvae]
MDRTIETHIESGTAETSRPRRSLWRTGLLSLALLSLGFVIGRSTAPLSAPPGAVPTPTGSGSSPSDPSAAETVSVTRQATLEEVLQMARQGLQQLEQNIDDYTATMVKQERIGNTLREPETMNMKLQTRRVQDGQTVRPMRVYLHFSAPASMAGQEVIWSEGANDGKLIAHKGGLWNVMRASLKPDSFLAMTGNRYPITQIGMTNLVRKLIARGELDQQTASATVSITSGHRVGDRICNLIQVRHAEPNGRPDDFSLAEIAIDAERQIPLRYTAFGWPAEGTEAPLLESYTYLDVELNVGLTDQDFDPDNPAYNYP